MTSSTPPKKEHIFTYVCRWCGEERQIIGKEKLMAKQKRHYQSNPCLPCQMRTALMMLSNKKQGIDQ